MLKHSWTLLTIVILQPKLWDWDGVDQDYFSAAGSTGPSPALAGGGPIPLNIGSGPRPTTSAAVYKLLYTTYIHTFIYSLLKQIINDVYHID